MSYAIHPFAVSLAEIRKAIGSRDSNLADELLRKFGDTFPGIDELDEDAVSMKQAVAELVMRAKLNQDSGMKYGYALKFLCEHLGRMLSNEFWSDVGWDWIETVDKALTAAGVDKKVFRLDPHLTARGSPIALPKIADFPAIGYLLEAEMATVLIALPKMGDRRIKDEEVAESLSAIRAWLDQCARTHHDLVCFYH